MKEELVELGLNGKEVEVYLYLLKTEKQTATKIAKDIKINRSVVYSILEGLIDKGLVNFVLINGTRHFSSTDPKFLEQMHEDKGRILNKILPDLKDIRKSSNEDFSVEVFQGIKGGIAVLKDILNEGKDYVSFGDEGQFESVSETVLEQYLRRLDEKNIKERILTVEGFKFKYSRKKTEIRYLPKTFKFLTITTIYANKVAIAVFDKPHYVLLINSKTLAETYRAMFYGLWAIAKK